MAKTRAVHTSDESGLVLALDGGSLRVGRIRADAGKETAQEFSKRAGLSARDRFESA